MLDSPNEVFLVAVLVGVGGFRIDIGYCSPGAYTIAAFKVQDIWLMGH